MSLVEVRPELCDSDEIARDVVDWEDSDSNGHCIWIFDTCLKLADDSPYAPLLARDIRHELAKLIERVRK